MKRLLACTAAALVLFTAACGVLEDEVAATVNGNDYSTSEITNLASTAYIATAAEANQVGLVGKLPGSAGGASQRVALTFVLQAAVYEDAVKAQKGSIEADDIAGAEQQLSEFEQQQQQQQQQEKPFTIDPAARKVIARLVAAESALRRIYGEQFAVEITDDQIKNYFEDNEDQFGLISCVDGFAVAEAQGVAAQAALDGGNDIDEILADAALQAQPLSQDGAEVCVPVGSIAEPDLGALVESGPIGEWSATELADPQAGNLVVYIRPNSREVATLDTPAVVQQITSALQQDAETQVQAKISDALSELLLEADVTIDPRYGRWDPTDPMLVLAPPVPAQPGPPSTTTPPLNLG